MEYPLLKCVLEDDDLLDCLIKPILDSASLPKFGTGKGVKVDEFTENRKSDPLYGNIGLDTPEIYAAHAGSSVITSAYRQLGIGLERAMRLIIAKECDFIDVPEDNPDMLKWYFDSATGITRELDLLISTEMFNDESKKLQLYELAKLMKPGFSVESSRFKGIVFEIRQGYQSADSKRVKGDLEIVTKAEEKGFLAVVMIGSNSYNDSVISTYKNGGLPILVPSTDGQGKSHECPYCFFNYFIDYDLRSALARIGPKAKSQLTSHIRRRLGLN